MAFHVNTTEIAHIVEALLGLEKGSVVSHVCFAFLFHTVAIASLGFFRIKSFRVWFLIREE